MSKIINLPLTKDKIKDLKAGDSVLLNGIIYTARDAAHKRMVESGVYPFDIKNQVIYFAGPTPNKEGQVIGSCGPTTSSRMDAYSPTLIKDGLTGMIGKGERDKSVIDAMKTYGAVYFGAIGGCGALISKCIKSSKIIAYDDLGTEAIRQLTVENFPADVVIDRKGYKI